MHKAHKVLDLKVHRDPKVHKVQGDLKELKEHKVLLDHKEIQELQLTLKVLLQQ